MIRHRDPMIRHVLSHLDASPSAFSPAQPGRLTPLSRALGAIVICWNEVSSAMFHVHASPKFPTVVPCEPGWEYGHRRAPGMLPPTIPRAVQIRFSYQFDRRILN